MNNARFSCAKSLVWYCLAVAKSAGAYFYDARRFLKAALLRTRSHQTSRALRILALDYHAIEKGLSNSEMRPRFGRPKVVRLKQGVLAFRDNPEAQRSTHYQSALHAILNYYNVHAELGIDVSDIVSKDEYKSFSQYFGTSMPSHVLSSSADFSRAAQAPFETFAQARRSIRQFKAKPIELDLIKKISQLANSAPSVCNRQSARIHFFQDREKIQSILALQRGNTGFGHQIRNLAILTSDMEYFVGTNERNQPYIDGGIYLMNFLYSCFYYKVGAVALNWATLPARDKAIRNVAEISERECIICLVGMGYPDDEYTTPASRKLSHDESLFIR